MSTDIGLSRASVAPLLSHPEGRLGPPTLGLAGQAQTADVPSAPQRPIRQPDAGSWGGAKQTVGSHRHAAPTRTDELLASHGAQFARFSAIGGASQGGIVVMPSNGDQGTWR
jgi:hypothetical protein